MGTTTTNPPAPTPAPKTNRIGLQVVDYRGGKTTLCAGCGHNAIFPSALLNAMYEMGVPPERVAKLAGSGGSRRGRVFYERSHSFNSVHGRMPSVATGARIANKTLMAPA